MRSINCNCSCNCGCTVAAFVASVIIGVIAAFLQITAMITIPTALLWAAAGVAVVYLGGLAAALLLSRCPKQQGLCGCAALNALLLGILGTILTAVILLVAEFAATSVLGAIIVGLLAASLTLIFTATACYARTLTDCES